MKRLLVAALILAGCSAVEPPAEHYGFIARLGQDTLSVERVTRRGNRITSDEVDRFPRVRRRHTEIELREDGGIRRIEMTIHTPSDPPEHRERKVVAEVTGGSIHLTREDGGGRTEKIFAIGGAMSMAHVPQMYSLYELYFRAALQRARATHRTAGDTVVLRQFYLDREFDEFPLHRGIVRLGTGGRAEITHGWLAGTGEATLDGTGRMLSYSGARTTYLVEVTRLPAPPEVDSVARRFEALEAERGMRQLSVRDTARLSIGATRIWVDYGRPRARGRRLLGEVIPYDRVWRTGANAATQLSTSGPITLAGMTLPAGTYTLWTIPRAGGAELIVNRETGQWGTGYQRAHDLGRAPMRADTTAPSVEQFTISLAAQDSRTGTLTMAWGPFRWTAAIEAR